MKKIKIYTIILCCWAFATSVTAQGIGLRFPDTTMVQGDTLLLPLIIDSTLTGEEVYSFNLDVTYDSYYLEYVGVSNGELTASFGDLLVNAQTDESVLITGASAMPLVEAGTLLYVHFKAVRRHSSGTTVSLATSSILNEGLPLIVSNAGKVSIAVAPSITLRQNNADLLIGETFTFDVYGDTISPFVYEVVDPSIGTIDANGLFTALAAGSTKVKVTDANGTVDFTNDDINVFSVRLTTPLDQEQWQGGSIDIPVILYDKTATDLISGSFKMSFDDRYLSFNSYSKVGDLLENASVEVVAIDDETLMVSFASSQAIAADSVLLHLNFDVSRINRGYCYLNYSDILFNETFVGMSERGKFQTINFQTIYLSSYEKEMIVGDVMPLSFYGGIEPYTYESSASNIASISTEGIVTAVAGGDITITAIDSVGSQKVTDNIHVYDTYIEIPDTTGPEATVYLLPVFIGTMPAGVSASAFQMSFSYESPELEFLEVVTSGTLSDGWSVVSSQSDGEIIISGANTTSITGGGILVYLKFWFTSDFTINENAWVRLESAMLNEGYPTAFLRDGSIKCVLPEDLLISELIAPMSDCELSAEEEVIVEIKNNGYVDYHAGDTLLVSYRVYYENTVYDTIILTQDFPMKSVMNYTFEEKANFSQDNKNYNFEVQTELSSDRDANPSNDRIYTQIYNYKDVSLDLGEDIFTCEQGPVVVTAPDGYDHYKWSTGAKESYVSVDTTTTLWLRVTNEHGCEITDTIDVTIYPIPEKPVISFTSQEGCVGETLYLEAPAGYAAYKWTTGERDSILGVTQSGEYAVIVYNEGMCKSDTSEIIDVIFYDKPTADFSYTSDGLRVSFTNLSTSATSYKWYFGDGSNSEEMNPVHTYTWSDNNDFNLKSASVSSELFSYYVRLISHNGSCIDVSVDTIPSSAFLKSSIVEKICDGESYTFGDEVLIQSGTYYHNFQNPTGIDSIVKLDLKVIPLYNDTLEFDICHYESYEFGGELLTEPGVYTDSLLTESGCDSISTLILGVFPNRDDSTFVTISEGDYYVFGGDTLRKSGIYTMDVAQSPVAAPIPCMRQVLTLNVEPASGLDKVYNNYVVRVYPNPVKDIVRFTSNVEMSTVTIYNGLGLEMFRQEVKGTQVELNLSAVCSPGIFFARILSFYKQELVIKVLIE